MTFVVFLIAGNAGAQSVTIGAIPGSRFCAGDPISVSFTATGTWGRRNAFTLQISDPSGSFSNGFLNLGSLVDTLPGTFTINATMPSAASTHYRLRILAANPYVTSADNGSDIAIATAPGAFTFYPTSIAGAVGTTVSFAASINDHDEADARDTGHWDFGSGATPATATTTAIDYGGGYVGLAQAQTTYSTTGDKTITLRTVKAGGCPSTPTNAMIHIYDCSIPSIPHDAIVVDSVGQAVSKKTYWVNPGATLFFGDGDTIFAEPGSKVYGPTSPGYCVMYMKPGSVLNSRNGDNVVIFSDGASLSTKSSDFTLNCPTLDFDYTNAPPNHPLAVLGELKSVLITLSPNPTRGMLQVQGLPPGNTTVSVFNLLGQLVVLQKDLRTRECTLDLSKLLPGAYYVRISSANSVVTKKVVRE